MQSMDRSSFIYFSSGLDLASSVITVLLHIHYEGLIKTVIKCFGLEKLRRSLPVSDQENKTTYPNFSKLSY